MSSINNLPPVQQQAVQNTGSTGTLGKIKDFFVGIGNGLARAANAIGHFFTETLPNAFKSLTERNAQQVPAPQLPRAQEGPDVEEGGGVHVEAPHPDVTVNVSAGKLPRHDELTARVDTLQRTALEKMRGLPDVTVEDVAPGTNPIRTNKLPTAPELSDRVLDTEDGLAQLSVGEALNLTRLTFQGQQVLPNDKLLALLTHDSIPGAIGDMTFKNSLTEKPVPDNSPQEKREAALALRDHLRENLTPQEFQALKTRVDFLAQLPELALAKYGVTSEKERGDGDKALKTWQKSVCVSAGAYFGADPVKMQGFLGTSFREGNNNLNDAMVALVLHHDTIFG